MAHDLKNPLAALMTNLHFLQATASGQDQDAVDALGESLTLCEMLDRLLRNLELLGRARGIAARPQMVSVSALAHEAVTRAQRHAAAAGVTLKLAGDGEGDLSAFVDRDLFCRALENLIANALESAPSGSTVLVSVPSDAAEPAIVIEDARESPPARPEGAAALAPSARLEGKRPQETYGRGLSLLCADITARATGARLEIGGAPRACRLRLVAPARA